MLKFFKFCFDFYIKSSIHVALAVTCLGSLTVGLVPESDSQKLLIFIFFSTLFTYNFIKYFPLFFSGATRKNSAGILSLSSISGLVAFGIFFTLNFETKIFVIFGGFLVIVYTIPFFGETSNWRNKKGWKIHLVALCWVLLTVGAPLTFLNNLSFALFLKGSLIQFIYVWVATLPFEIRDVSTDDLSLRTIPQQFGIHKTKIIGLLLLGIGLFVSVFLYNFMDVIPILIAYVMLGISLYYSTPEKSKYYTSFWIEGIPMIWWLSFHLISYFY